MRRCSIEDEKTLAQSATTQVLLNLLQMLDENVGVNSPTNNVKSNHFIKGVRNNAGIVLSSLVGRHVCILSFLGPPVATDSLVRELIFITEDRLLSFLHFALDLLCTLKTFGLIVFSESSGRTVMQNLVRVLELVYYVPSHGTHRKLTHRELPLDHSSKLWKC